MYLDLSALNSSLVSLPATPKDNLFVFIVCTMAIEESVKKLSSAISKALAESTPNGSPREDQQLSIPARIQDEIA
jgi:hypothetical protein